MKEYKKNLYKRETEVLEPGCLALSASAIKHHYYPKPAIKASIKALKNAVKTIKTLKSKFLKLIIIYHLKTATCYKHKYYNIYYTN